MVQTCTSCKLRLRRKKKKKKKRVFLPRRWSGGVFGDRGAGGNWRAARTPAGRLQFFSTMQSLPAAQPAAERLGLGARRAAELGEGRASASAGAAVAGVGDRLAGEHGGVAVPEPGGLALRAIALAVGGDDDAPGQDRRSLLNSRKPGWRPGRRSGLKALALSDGPRPGDSRGGASRQVSASGR